MKGTVVLKQTLMQESDTCDPDDCGQFLDIEIEDGGAGSFVVLKTKRWALDEENIDELATHLKSLIAQYDEHIEDLEKHHHERPQSCSDE